NEIESLYVLTKDFLKARTSDLESFKELFGVFVGKVKEKAPRGFSCVSMSDQKKRRILFRFKMFCSVIENFVSKEKQRGKNRMIWSDKKKHSNECFFCVLSVAKNEFFLFLIHIETTSFYFYSLHRV